MSRVGRSLLIFPWLLLSTSSGVAAPTDKPAPPPAAPPQSSAPPSGAAKQDGDAWPDAAQQQSNAQQPSSAPPNAAQQLVDVVVLKDGRLVRGNITQLAPGQFVIIRLANGELQKIALSDTNYAGPIVNMPDLSAQGSAQVIAPSTTAKPGPVPGAPGDSAALAKDPEYPVAFEGNEPGLTLHVRTATALSKDSEDGRVEGYRALCTAPCSVKLRSTSYQFGVGRGATIPMPTEQTVYVREPIRLLAKVHDYESTRYAGFVTLIASGALLFASTIALASDCSSLDPKRCGTVGSLALFPGLPLSVVGGVVGIVLGTRTDWAEIVQVPNTPKPLADTGLDTRLDARRAARLTVSGRFW